MTSAPNDPELFFAEDGAPRSGRFGDIYYSLQDGLAESRAVFLAGCHLPEAWQDRRDFCVMELGFGTGLNIAALLQLWAAHRPDGGHLHIFTIEGFLMEAGAARTALDAWPELAEFTESILAQWPRSRRGFHYMDFPQWGVSLTLALDDVRSALEQWQGHADAIFLDGFSPALNPDMWADDVLGAVAGKARPGTRLATFTVAGFVRRGLQAAGFTVAKCPGFGRKRERLEAVFAAEAPVTSPGHPRRIAIVGAGIAGACLAWQARLAGLEADLFDTAGAGAGASGNAAALVTPRLDAGDPAIAGLFADALSYATGLYRRLAPAAILSDVTLLCESSPRDSTRFDKLVGQDIYAEGDIGRFAPGEAADIPDRGGLHLGAAMAVMPQVLLTALLEGQALHCGKVTGWSRRPDAGFAIETAEGTRSGYDAIVLACGDGLIDLTHDLDLRPVRGQVEYVDSDVAPDLPISWGGYIVPVAGGFVFGATHDREDRGCDIRGGDVRRNIDTLSKALPHLADRVGQTSSQSRAAIRITTRDHLPAIGEVEEGVFVLTGLGGRGFCLAPLLARAVIAEITGIPSPLPLRAKKITQVHRLRRP